jgi:hypothetical protein
MLNCVYTGSTLLAIYFVVRQFIGEALAGDPHQSGSGTASVIDAKSDAVAVPERKFSGIAVQMLLVAMLVDTFHAALEAAAIAFHGARRHVLRAHTLLHRG